MYEGRKEKEEGAREPPGFLVTEEGELVPGTRLATLHEGKGSGEGHKLGPGNVGVRCPQGGRPIGIRLRGPGVGRGKLGWREACP